MKILLVHNFYGSTAPSGENKVFEAEKRMLQSRGETVEFYTRHSDEIRVVVSRQWLVVRIKKILNLVRGALCTIGNPFAARQLAKKIAAFRPDVVHFHNTFPLISPLAVWAAHRSGAKVVMTLHNYRLVCAGGVPMRGGKVCRDCFREKVGRLALLICQTLQPFKFLTHTLPTCLFFRQSSTGATAAVWRRRCHSRSTFGCIGIAGRGGWIVSLC